MAGHSKWKQIKHYKAATDAKRGALFTRLIREITMAAKQGGGDPAGNARLRTAIENAKADNLPKENIERAVKKGTGELEGVDYQEVLYEAYGPGGVAVLVECLTDNRNRANAEVRTAITRNGGNPADPGSVSYLFGRKGVILVVKTDGLTEDDVLLAVLDAGAEEVNDLDDHFEVVSDATDTHAVRPFGAMTTTSRVPSSGSASGMRLMPPVSLPQLPTSTVRARTVVGGSPSMLSRALNRSTRRFLNPAGT